MASNYPDGSDPSKEPEDRQEKDSGDLKITISNILKPKQDKNTSSTTSTFVSSSMVTFSNAKTNKDQKQPEGNGTHGYNTRSRSQEEGKMDTYSKAYKMKVDKTSHTLKFVRVSNEVDTINLSIDLMQCLKFQFVIESEEKFQKLSIKIPKGVQRIQKDPEGSNLIIYLNEENVPISDIRDAVVENLKAVSSDIMALQKDSDGAVNLCKHAKKLKEWQNNSILLHIENENKYWVFGYTNAVAKVCKQMEDLNENRLKSKRETNLDFGKNNGQIRTERIDNLETSQKQTTEKTQGKRDITENQDIQQTIFDQRRDIGSSRDQELDMENIIKKPIELFSIERKILDTFHIAQQVVKKFPGCKIDYTEAGILLYGKINAVNQTATALLYEIKEVLNSRKRLDLKPQCMKLLHFKETFDYVMPKLKEHACFIDFSEGQIYVYTQNTEDVNHICSIVQKLVVQKQLENVNDRLWKNESFASKIHSFESKFSGRLEITHDITKRNVVVVGTDDVVTFVLGELEKLIAELRKVVSDTFEAPKLQVMYYRKHISMDFKDVAEKFDVAIEAVSKTSISGWTIKGISENVRLAKLEMEKAFEAIQCENIYIESADSQMLFGRDDVKREQEVIHDIEESHGCKVDMKSCLFVKDSDADSNESVQEKKWIYKNGRMIGLLCNTDPSSWTEYYVSPFAEEKLMGVGEDISYPQRDTDKKISLPVPVWKNGEQQEKETVRRRLGDLFAYLVKNKISSITFPFEMEKITKWKDMTFLKQVLYAFFKCQEGAFATLKCFFVHSSNDQCFHAMKTIEKFLKNSLEDGTVFATPYSFKMTDNIQGISRICTKVRKGKLAECKADVLVNTTSKDLNLNNGAVSTSILKKAGPQIQRECSMNYPNGITYGTIAVTSGCNLKCVKVYHGALPGYGYEKTNNKSISVLKAFVINCLKEASSSGFKTICFPAIGTGNLGYPKHIVAKTMFDAVEDFEMSGENRTLSNIDFVIFPGDQGSVKVFEEEEKYRCELQKKISDANYMKDFCLKFDDGKALILSFGDVLDQDLEYDGMVLFWKKKTIYGDPSMAKPFLKKAGETFKNEWSKKGKSLPNCMCLVTTGGSLPCSKILHQIADMESGDLGIIQVFEKCCISEGFESLLVPIAESDFSGSDLKQIAFSLYKAFSSFMKKSKIEDMLIVKIVMEKPGVFISVKEELIKLHPETFSAAGCRMCKGFRFSVICLDKASIDSAVDEIKRKFQVSPKPLMEHDKESEEPQPLPRKKKLTKSKNKKSNGALNDSEAQMQSDGHTSTRHSENIIQLIKTDCESCRVKFTILDGNLFSEGTKLVKNELKGIFYDLQMTPVIVVPYGVSHQGILKFSSPKDASDFLQRFYRNKIPSLNNKYEFFECPAQVLTNMSAELSVEVVEQLSKQKFEELQKRVSNNSGAHLEKDKGCMCLEGSLTDIEIAQEYLCQFLDAQDKTVEKANKNLKSVTLESKPVSTDMNVDSSDNSLVSSVTSTLPEKTISISTEKKDESFQKHQVILSKEEYEMLMQTNGTVLQQAQVKHPGNNEIVFFGDKQSLIEIQEAKAALQQMKTDELTDLTNEEMEKAVKYQTQIDKKYPKVYLRQLLNENKIKIFGELYDDVKTVKTALMVAVGRQKETGRRKRILPNQADTTAITSFKPKDEEIFRTAEGISVYVYTGDILYLNVDAIVNASNKRLEHKHGIASVIAQAAGDGLVQECRKYVHNNGSLSAGAIAVTQSGNLTHYKCIIHAVGPRYDDYPDKSLVKDDLKKTVLGCFFAATREELHSIALPAISSGIFKVPLQLCIEAYVESVQEFSNTTSGNTSLKEIHFVDLDPNATLMIESGFKNPRPPFAKSVADKNSVGQPPVKHFPVEIPAAYDETYNIIHRYRFGGKLTVNICTGNILDAHYPVNAVVSSENEEFCGQGQLASLLLKKGGRKYKEAHEKLKKKKWKLGDVTKSDVGDHKHLYFVVHAVMPAWNSELSTNQELKKSYFETLSSCIANILGYANKIGIKIIAFPLFGSGGKNPDIELLCKTLGDVLLTFGGKHTEHLQFIYIVNEHDWLSRKINTEFKKLTEESYSPKQNVNGGNLEAFSKAAYGTQMNVNSNTISEGQQPNGTFRVCYNSTLKLPGHETYGTIEMEIDFPGGKQTVGHLNPGKRYGSFHTVIYLPDSYEGKKLCELLRKAFKRKLLFKIIHGSEKEDKITWSEIHLKSNVHGGMKKHGYPDAAYLPYLREKLQLLGVTESEIDV